MGERGGRGLEGEEEVWKGWLEEEVVVILTTRALAGEAEAFSLSCRDGNEHVCGRERERKVSAPSRRFGGSVETGWNGRERERE